jgi:hypothetical protein
VEETIRKNKTMSSEEIRELVLMLTAPIKEE